MTNNLIGELVFEYKFEIYVSDLYEKLLSNCLITSVPSEKIQKYFREYFKFDDMTYDFKHFHLFVVSFHSGRMTFNFLQINNSLFDEMSFLYDIFSKYGIRPASGSFNKIRFCFLSDFDQKEQIYEWILQE